jgi:hypothetical protein
MCDRDHIEAMLPNATPVLKFSKRIRGRGQGVTQHVSQQLHDRYHGRDLADPEDEHPLDDIRFCFRKIHFSRKQIRLCREPLVEAFFEVLDEHPRFVLAKFWLQHVIEANGAVVLIVVLC